MRYPIISLTRAVSGVALASAFAACSTIGVSSATAADEALSSRESSPGELESAPHLIAQAADATLINYRTAEYSVRIYREGGQIYMNVYDRGEDLVRLRRAPAVFTYRDSGIPAYISTGEYSDRQARYITNLFEGEDGDGFARLLILDSDNGIIDEEDATEILAFTVPEGAFENAQRDTILRFNTPTYAVRVFTRSGQRLMNVYNNFTGTDLVNGKAASLVMNPRPPYDNAVSYVASGTLNNQPVEYYARITGSGTTVLEIYNINGQRVFEETSTGPVVVNIPSADLPPGVGSLEGIDDAYVAAVFGGQETLDRVQTLYPEAFIDRSARQGSFINAGSFPNIDAARLRVFELKSQGFGNARVVFRDVRYR